MNLETARHTKKLSELYKMGSSRNNVDMDFDIVFLILFYQFKVKGQSIKRWWQSCEGLLKESVKYSNLSSNSYITSFGLLISPNRQSDVGQRWNDVTPHHT